jgi:hypothetical protein
MLLHLDGFGETTGSGIFDSIANKANQITRNTTYTVDSAPR